MPQLSPVDVLPSLGYRIDSQYFQPTNASDSSASLSSALKDMQQALLERDREIERQDEEIRLLRLQLLERVPLDDQVLMDV